MTVWDTLGAVRRHLLVVVVAMLCTGLALYAMSLRPPVYYSRGEVRFLAPSSALYPNTLQTSSVSLVVTAGAVAKRINGTYAPTRFSSREATLVGRGTWHGTQIALADNGVQWAPNFNSPNLDVEVAAASIAEVEETRAALHARIAAELEAMQDEYGVEAHNRITVQPVPTNPAIISMPGRPRMAQAMTLLLGGIGALTGVWAFERRSIRQRGLVDGRVNGELARAST